MFLQKLKKKYKKIILIIVCVIILLNLINLVVYYEDFTPYIKSSYERGKLLKFLYKVNLECLIKYTYKTFFYLKKAYLIILSFFK